MFLRLRMHCSNAGLEGIPSQWFPWSLDYVDIVAAWLKNNPLSRRVPFRVLVLALVRALDLVLALVLVLDLVLVLVLVLDVKVYAFLLGPPQLLFHCLKGC